MDAASNDEKPAQVTLTIKLLWASLALGAVNSALSIFQMGGGGIDFLVPAVVIGLTAFLYAKIAARRNWARLVFAVLTVLGALPFLLSVGAIFADSVLAAGLTLAILALQLAALYLLFTAPGKDWFVPRPPATP